MLHHQYCVLHVKEIQIIEFRINLNFCSDENNKFHERLGEKCSTYVGNKMKYSVLSLETPLQPKFAFNIIDKPLQTNILKKNCRYIWHITS